MPRIPVYHGVFEDFLILHPDGDVMIWNDQRHRDGRHGHGAAEFPGKPGLEKGFLSSIQAGEVDPRFRENELMLTVNDEFGVWSFPYEEIWKAGHAVNVEINGVPIAVLCLPGTNTAGAYHRTDDGEVLSFERSSGGLFADDRTDSRWNVEGLCVSGARKGHQLEPAQFVTVEWHATVSFHPELHEWACGEEVLDPEPSDDKVLIGLLQGIGESGFAVGRPRSVMNGWMPASAVSGIDLLIDSHPVRLFHFGAEKDAEDWAETQKRAVASGCVAAGSFPTIRFEDIAQKMPLPDDQVDWAPAIADERLATLIRGANESCGKEHQRPTSLIHFLAEIESAGHGATQVEFMLEPQLPSRAEVGFSMVIKRDRFQLFRFGDESEAAAEAAKRGHAIAAGRFLLWSDPPGQYKQWSTINLPDEEVDWSPLLESAEFVSLIDRSLT